MKLRKARTAREAVRNAAKAMDVIAPDWYNQVDKDTLNVFNPRYCIMGQVFGGSAGFATGIEKIQTETGYRWDSDQFMYPGSFAFATHNTNPLWLAEIDQRRN